MAVLPKDTDVDSLERRRGTPRSQGVSGSQAAALQDPRRTTEAEESEVIFFRPLAKMVQWPRTN